MVAVKQVTSKSARWTLELIFESSGFKRTVTGLLLLAYFALSLYVGVPFTILNTLIIQMKSFKEVMDIAYRIKKWTHIPFFGGILWYFIFVANYFIFIETFEHYTVVFINRYYVLQVLVSYHRFISFCLYLIGLIFFVSMLNKDLIVQQFSILSWAHFLILILTVQSYLFIQNVYEGFIWLLVPFIQVIINDTFAYLIGKNFGRTPLITLSPKKTVEGFVGGGLATIILGTILSYIFCNFNYLVCPIKYTNIDSQIITITNCTPSSLFQSIPYQVGNTNFYLNHYPFIRHTLYMATFVSVIGPFGGFFASGFKRATDIKDFGNVIPGHGGFMDRFDCCFFMGTFVNVYISTFIKNRHAEDIFQKVISLDEVNQLKFYLLLNSSLSGHL